MVAARLPVDEPARLRSLHALEVLDSSPDAEFDALVRAAAVVCGAPVSLVSLVDSHRQWIKASSGLGDLGDLGEVPRADSFCAHVILEDGIVEVPDLTQDARFSDSPYVTPADGFRFYVAAPLRLSDGATVGTLCVLDHAPRRLAPEQRELLALLALATVKALESRSNLLSLRRASAALAQSEAVFRTLSETSPMGVFQDDAQGRCTYVNARHREIMGQAVGEAQGFGWTEAVHPDDRPRLLEAAMQGPAVRTEQQFVARLLRRDGSERTIQVSKRPIFGADDEVAGYVGTVEDATERLATVERLAQGERRLRWLYEATPALLHSLDGAGRIVTVSDRWLARLGYAREEVLGRPLSDFTVPGAPPSTIDSPGGPVAPAAAGATAFDAGDADDTPIRLRTKAGERIEGLCSTVVERDAGGRPLRAVTVVDDVTDQVHTEHALKSERRRLKSVVDATLAGTWEWNAVTGESRFDEGWAAIVGYTLEQLGPQSLETWQRLTHPDDVARADPLLAAHFTGITPYYEIEARMRHRQGHWIWILSRGRVMSWTADGRPEMVVGTHLDVTLRKQQEDTLRQSERFLKRTGEVAGVGGWEFDPATGKLFLSEAVCRMLDCEPGHPPGIQDLRLLYTPQTLALMAQVDRRARHEGIGWDVEIELRSFTGRKLWLRNVAEVESRNGVLVRLVGSTQDITAVVEQRRAVERAQQRLALATESGGIGIWEFDLHGNRLVFDALTCRAFGIDAEEQSLALEDGLALLHPEDVAQTLAAAQAAVRDEQPFDIGLRIVWPDASVHHLRATARVTRDAAGRLGRMVGACWDVTPIHRLGAELAEQHEMLRVTLQSIGDAVVTTDAGGHVTWLNPIAERMTGWPTAEAQGRPLEQVFRIVHEETRIPAENPVALCLARGTTTGLAHLTLLISRDGSEYGIEDSAAPICNDRGEVLGAVLVFHDVTETRRLAGEMSYRAMHDALTGLVNRVEFESRLARLLEKAQGDHSEHALLYIDLDQFKIVNDTCGHSVGDQLLQQVARLLLESVRSRDTVARLGGDEFAVILEHCPGPQAERIAQTICDRMNEARFVHDAKRFRIGTSIGLVPLDARWAAVSTLMQAADTSCYAAKDEGRNRVHVWFDTDQAMRDRYTETRWATRLEQALDENRFVLFAQRIEKIGERSGGLHAEVLIRLVDADGSLVAPGAFLPAAERFHLSSRIDRWVMHGAISALAAQPELASIDMLAVNLSGKSIGDRAFHRHALELLAGAGDAICRVLCLEITETAAVTNLADAALFIEQVRALGVRIALDDFGAGASSFGYLKTLRVDVLKIDGQFIRNVLDDALDDAAVRCFVDVARVMGLKTVAEFVDSPAVLTRLAAIGVDYAQGYLLHRPEPLGNVLGHGSAVVLSAPRGVQPALRPESQPELQPKSQPEPTAVLS